MELDALLADAVAADASDIHLKVGRPPLLRRDGDVTPLAGFSDMTAADLGLVLRTLTAGRRLWDRTRLRIPMRIGDTIRKITIARFARTLSTLVAAGVDIITALEITGQASGSYVFEQALLGVRQRVHEGSSIAQPLIENSQFPPMVSQMVRIGEETGEMEKMLKKVAEFYEDEVEASIEGLTSIIEPVMMILVGAMIGVILIAMYLPMFKMLTLVSNGAG